MRHLRLTLAASLTVAGHADAQIAFTDVTHEAGLDLCVHATAPGYPGNHETMVGGGAVGDFNRDGLPDIFFLSGGIDPDRLLINTGEADFVDQAAQWGVASKHRGAGACVGDVDNDGWLDIYVTSYGDADLAPAPGRHRLYHNNAGKSFTDIAVQAGVNAASQVTDGMGAAFGDYDRDGDLDLYVASWFDWPGSNRLFRNDGNAKFTDVTDEAGVAADGLRGFSPSFADMNADMWPELLVTGDFHSTRYFLNNADATFTDTTEDAGIGEDCNAMGSAIADVDGDGDVDWYITNIDYAPSSDPCGNVLYLADNPHHFVNVADDAGVRAGGWGWGTGAPDLDQDGLLDILATSGWPQYPNVPTRVYHNLGAGQFEDVAAQAGLVLQGKGRGLVTFDYDLDGDLDVLIFQNAGPLRLYRNDVVHAPSSHWLWLDLRAGDLSCQTPDAFGARVELHVGDQVIIRSVDAGCHYLSQAETGVHVGLGAATTVDEITISWPTGRPTTLHDVNADQRLQITQAHAADINADGTVNQLDLAALQKAFSAGDDAADLNADGVLSILDFIEFQRLAQGGCPTLPR